MRNFEDDLLKLKGNLIFIIPRLIIREEYATSKIAIDLLDMVNLLILEEGEKGE